ncbi:TetR family transcriptional regulator, partial [Acinetobacter seifertii]
MTNEIYSLLRRLQANILFNDAKLSLYMSEGTIIRLLSLDKRDDMFACFSKVFIKR